MIRATQLKGALCLFLLILTTVSVAQNVPRLQQTPSSSATDDDSFKLPSVDVELVQIPVSVSSKDGKPIESLPKSSFQVLEDNVVQDIKLFVHEDIPLS